MRDITNCEHLKSPVCLLWKMIGEDWPPHAPTATAQETWPRNAKFWNSILEVFRVLAWLEQFDFSDRIEEREKLCTSSSFWNRGIENGFLIFTNAKMKFVCDSYAVIRRFVILFERGIFRRFCLLRTLRVVSSFPRKTRVNVVQKCA